MYLYRKSWLPGNDEWIRPESRTEITITEGGKPKDTSKIRYVVEEVGYWRKANAIHRWFVENVQDGEDDCGEYYVSQDKLEQLLAICEAVNKEKYELFAESIEQVSAKTLLPTQSGFFFGSTEYDEYYYEDIANTISILREALADGTGDYYYSSSW